MQYFVLNNDVITGVIHTEISMHTKSSKYIPTTKESLATYQKWLTANPNQQPTLANIFTSSTSKLSAISTNANVSNPLSKPAAKPNITKQSNRSALAKQFQQFINKR